VAVLLEFVLAVTAASMPIVTLGINGQGGRTSRVEHLPDDHLHGRTSMPIKSAGIVPELLREPSQEWSGGGWRAASTFLPRSEARPIRIPYNRSRANSARRELGRLIAPRRLAS
jgi:hypothetical protein